MAKKERAVMGLGGTAWLSITEGASATAWWAVVILTAAALFAIFGIAGSFMRLRSADGSDASSDDDETHWFAGFYNNPDDSHVFVKVRSLPQLTVNLGHPVGRVLMLLSVSVIVAIDVLVVVAYR